MTLLTIFAINILEWLVSKISEIILILFFVLYFTLFLFLTVLMLRYKNITTLNRENQHFFKRSLTTTLALAIILGIAGALVVFLLMLAFVAALGMGSNPISVIIVASGIGGMALAIFSSDASSIAFFVIVGLILLIIAMEGIKNGFRVKTVPAILGLLIWVGLAIGFEAMLEVFGLNLFQIISNAAQWVENWVIGLI
jgi:hypothetical protein